jgi:hypothetical protein
MPREDDGYREEGTNRRSVSRTEIVVGFFLSEKEMTANGRCPDGIFQ